MLKEKTVSTWFSLLILLYLILFWPTVANLGFRTASLFPWLRSSCIIHCLSPIQPKVGTEAFRRCLETISFNKSWTR